MDACKIRGIQLDLARQMETPAFLRDYIDFIAENHYNTLLLYLEWRIRTRTFDIGEEEGYSAAELRGIIDYAAARGITVIPGLATLGHAELLLRQEKFASFSELREGITGRFGDTFSSDLCPSLPEVREFLKSYLTDVAEIFSQAPFFHVGGDEVFDMARCSLCRRKAPDLRGEAALYLEHIRFIHQLTARLGKRMMMWDDMFEFYPDILPEMPRDIIMVNWQYQSNVSGYRGHFCNCCFHESLERYDAFGFDYLAAPADFCWNNVDTSTAHAAGFHPMGFLLTSWEKSTSLLFKYFPVGAAAGRLWSGAAGNGDEAMRSAVGQLFGVRDEVFVDAVAEYAELANRMPSVSEESLRSFDFFGPDAARFRALQVTSSVFRSYTGKLSSARAENILTDMLFDCTLKLLELRSERACWALFHGMPGESPERIREEVAEVGARYAEFYSRHRRERDAGTFRTMIRNWCDALRDIPAKLASGGVLSLLFVLPDAYGAERLRILGNGEEIASGVQKHDTKTSYEKFFFLPADTVVKEVRIEAKGFAGQGVAYVEARTGKGKFIPDRVTGREGVVEHPEHLLLPDLNFTWLGTRNTLDAFRDRRLAEQVHSVTVAMKPGS